jgi:Flp pilus assembly protein TadD
MYPARAFFNFRLGIVLFCAVTVLFLSHTAYALSSIEGSVYDDKGNALQDIHVELLNEYGSSINRVRTDGAGRYRFDNLRDGRYSIRVRPFQLDFHEQQRPVLVATQNIRGGEGSGTFQADFYLVPRRVAFADKELGVIFAQEVPKEARKEYDQALDLLRDKKAEEGFSSLQKAIAIFPDYFDALHAAGLEFYSAKMYKEAIPYFLKAAEINAKSVTARYYIGFSLHHLGKEYDKAAQSAFQKAQVLAPGSAQILYGRGVVERALGNFAEAEKTLLSAKQMAKSPIPEIHKELAQLYDNDMKKYDAAADELELYMKSSDLGSSEQKAIKKIITGLRAKAKS